MSKAKALSQDDIRVGDRAIHSTHDFDKFNIIHGNRQVDKNHVRELQRLMVENGNLTNQFPIVVNANMEVIDGQHRLEALRGLGWEVAYIIEDDASIAMVRSINLGNKNWNWRDMAQSFADLGNKEYAWLLHFVDKHNLSFSIAMRFAGQSIARRTDSDYYQGNMVIADKTAAEDMVEHYKKALKYVDEAMSLRDFATSLYRLSQSPAYDKDRMIEKLKEKGYTLPIKASQNDFMRKLEEIYNSGLSVENKVRLF